MHLDKFTIRYGDVSRYNREEDELLDNVHNVHRALFTPPDEAIEDGIYDSVTKEYGVSINIIANRITGRNDTMYDDFSSGITLRKVCDYFDVDYFDYVDKHFGLPEQGSPDTLLDILEYE